MAQFDFDGIENAQVFDRGKYLPPDGKYKLSVVKTLVKNARKAGPSFIAEFIVEESNHPDVPVGDKRSWFQKLVDKDVAFPAIKEFMGALLGVDRNDKAAWKELEGKLKGILNEATNFEGSNEDHPLHGMKIFVTTWQKQTKQDRDFTVHDWEICEE